MPVHAQRLIASNGINQLDFIGLIIVGVMGNGAGAIPHFCAHFVAQVYDIAHFFLDHIEVFWCEGLLAIEIVIPSVFDHGANGDFDIGPNLLHGAGHDMRQIVTDKLEGLGLVFHRVKGNSAICVDWPSEIPMRVIIRCRDCFFTKGC